MSSTAGVLIALSHLGSEVCLVDDGTSQSLVIFWVGLLDMQFVLFLTVPEAISDVTKLVL